MWLRIQVGCHYGGPFAFSRNNYALIIRHTTSRENQECLAEVWMLKRVKERGTASRYCLVLEVLHQQGANAI